MSKVYLVRTQSFSSSHRLHAHGLSEAQNKALFGKCNHAAGHGHNYKVEVTLVGEVDPKTGILYSLDDLKAAIEKAVMEPMDHKNLNVDVEEFQGPQGLNPTAENIAIVIWNRLLRQVPGGFLFQVKLWETDKNAVVFRG